MEAVRLHRPDADTALGNPRTASVALVLSVALAAVLLSLLAVASGNNELLQRHYGLLLWLNVGIAIGWRSSRSNWPAVSISATAAGCSARG